MFKYKEEKKKKNSRTDNAGEFGRLEQGEIFPVYIFLEWDTKQYAINQLIY